MITFETFNNNTKGFTNMAYVYFHGELENRFGFDLVRVDNEHTSFEDGTFAVKVLEVDEPCTLRIWHNSEDELRGLITLNSDKEANEYAQQCFDKRVLTL